MIDRPLPGWYCCDDNSFCDCASKSLQKEVAEFTKALEDSNSNFIPANPEQYIFKEMLKIQEAVFIEDHAALFLEMPPVKKG